MLILSRKTGEEILIGPPGPGQVRVVLIEVRDSRKARIGIEAPAGVPVHRREIAERILANDPAA